MPSLHRQQYSFQGRVQGVGFRATACSIAGRFSVTGWVRNEPDNSVTLQVQGAPEVITAFIAELQRTMARNVTSVTHIDLSNVSGETTFSTRR
ncbi:MAG: acylphosphatase [Pyrinomonadaceae bacterium]|nr:acylphosphatase [Phycisphaerales bacterium]